MPFYKVNYSDFNPSNLIFEDTKEDAAKDASGKEIKYYRINIQYNYEVTTTDGRKTVVKAPLYIEGPKQTSRGPKTTVYPEKNNKEIHSMFTKYDLIDTAQYAFVNRDSTDTGTIHKLCVRCCQEVFDRKAKLGVQCRTLDSMIDLLHYPVKWTFGDDGAPKAGVNPAAVWKLMRYKYGADKSMTRETDFILPVNGGQKIDWKMIENAEIDHQPLFKVDNITIAGARPSIKMEVTSSVVFDIREVGNQNYQEDTIAKYSADPSMTARAMEFLKKSNVAPVVTPASPPKTAPKPEEHIVIPGIVSQVTEDLASVVVSTPAPVEIPQVVLPVAPVIAPTTIDVAPVAVPQVVLPMAPVAIEIAPAIPVALPAVLSIAPVAVEAPTLTSLINNAPVQPLPMTGLPAGMVIQNLTL
jgi:hypothetical protein